MNEGIEKHIDAFARNKKGNIKSLENEILKALNKIVDEALP